jgi:methyl-accepting chemotaxis protein
MNTQHELGDIDLIIDTNLFIGVYKKVSSGINKMVNDHIHVKKEAIRIFSEYGNGNFSANIEKLPGKKEFVNVAINQVQSNLININKEINQLALSAKDGNLKYRADEAQFKGDWAKLIKTINELIDNLLYPINETVEVLQEMSEGNLSVEMRGNYNGDHAILKNAINKTVALMPFKEAVMVLQNVSDGDLTTLMTGDYKGDSLLLKNALNNTIESISEILQQVANTVEEVTNGANQVSDASSSLSQGATEQAASLEEITSSMSEIGSKTNQNASNAKLASNLTFDAKETAMLGSREMDELQKSMHDISQSSKDISKIIKVIDEIAFQTNLLALNAAVEAARAGRHGKGFAVVAEEVRNLAARSAKAAKETAEMIETSIRTVEKGANIAQKTADVLENIKDGAVKAADLVGEIAVSSNEQAMAISQISEGLHQIDKVTQTNTASAEESASASEELSGQASNLKRMIMKFKLNGNTVNFSNNYLTTSQSKNYRLESKKKHLQAAPNNDDFINLTNDDFGRF